VGPPDVAKNLYTDPGTRFARDVNCSTSTLIVVDPLLAIEGAVPLVFAPRSRLVVLTLLPELAVSPAVPKVDRFVELDVLVLLSYGETSEKTKTLNRLTPEFAPVPGVAISKLSDLRSPIELVPLTVTDIVLLAVEPEAALMVALVPVAEIVCPNAG
jgi:hypothetical protein